MLSDNNPIIPTPQQKQAIEHVSGPMLVVAGAGTGKTTVLARRIVELIKKGHASPDEILAVTYTRNSARDLLRRVALLWHGSAGQNAIGKVAQSGFKLGTFHAYCYSILRECKRDFQLIDEKDLQIYLRRNIRELQLKHFVAAADPGRFLADLLEFFRRCEDELRSPDDYDAYINKLESGEIPLPRVSTAKEADSITDAEKLERCREIARVFRRVEEMLTRENLGTYGHVITRAVELLRDRNSGLLLDSVRKHARFILIDEFQDSNVAQIELARLLAGPQVNVFAVGDPDQAIYRFRGATTGAFDHFLKVFGVEKVKRVMMSDNRRSTEPILKSAFKAISENPDITSVQLPGGETWKRQPLAHARTVTEPVPLPNVRISGWDTLETEAAYVAQQIANQHAAGRRWSDCAVLYRTHSNRNLLVRELALRNIPFEVEGVDLLDVPEVRDLVSALRAMESKDPVGLLRLAALPWFCVVGDDLRKVLSGAGKNVDVEKELEKVPGGMDVVSALAEARHLLQNSDQQAGAAVAIARRCFQLAPSTPLDAFTQFVKCWRGKPQVISGNGTLREFLEYLDAFAEAGGRVADAEEDEAGTPATLQMERGGTPEERHHDKVHVMTVHAAKGLEFPVVFVLRLKTGSFPAKYRPPLFEFPAELRNPDTIPEDQPKSLHDQEERRLFYVSITRARDQLTLCGKAGTGREKSPPGYLRNLLTDRNRALSGSVEFSMIREGEVPRPDPNALPPASRIGEWIAMPCEFASRERRLSASAIERFERCPLNYKLGVDWNLPEKPAAQMQFGAAMHTALLGYYDGLRKGRHVSADDVVSTFLQQFALMKIDDPTQREMYERDGEQQLRDFLASPAAIPQGSVSMVEHKFSCDIGGAQVVGRIDRVDESEGGLTIVDYKTGRPKSQEVADDSLQLSIYALALSHHKPVRRLVFQNLQDNSSIITMRTPEELSGVEARVAKAASQIAAGEFEPRPGLHCGYCAFRSVCPATEIVITAAASPDSKQARQMKLFDSDMRKD